MPARAQQASDLDIITPFDASYCGLPKEAATTAEIDPKDLEDDGSVYRVGTRRWSLEEESRYAKWFEENVGQDFLTRHKIVADCADAAAAARMIYARIRKLPAVFVTDKYKYGFYMRAWRNYPTVRDWDETNWHDNILKDMRFRKFMYAVLFVIDSFRTMPMNTYPIELHAGGDESKGLSPFFHPGTLALLNGHVVIVSKIDPSQWWPIQVISSSAGTETANVLSLGFPMLEYYPAVMGPGQGIANWRWPANCGPGRGSGGTGWAPVQASAMPGYSEEQYALSYRSEEPEKLRTDVAEHLQALEYYSSHPSPLDETERKDRDLRAWRLPYMQASLAWLDAHPALRAPKRFKYYLQKLASDYRDDFPPASLVEDLLKELDSRLADRVKLVNEALDRLAKDPSYFSAKEHVEDYSTPSRDKGDCQRYETLTELAREYGAKNGWTESALLAALSAKTVDVGGGLTIHQDLYFKNVCFDGMISHEPTDSREKRWGLPDDAPVLPPLSKPQEGPAAQEHRQPPAERD